MVRIQKRKIFFEPSESNNVLVARFHILFAQYFVINVLPLCINPLMKKLLSSSSNSFECYD